MDISLVIKVISMKLAIHVAEIHCEGRVSQKFDIGYILIFSYVEEWTFKKVTKKYKSCPFFALK